MKNISGISSKMLKEKLIKFNYLFFLFYICEDDIVHSFRSMGAKLTNKIDKIYNVISFI